MSAEAKTTTPVVELIGNEHATLGRWMRANLSADEFEILAGNGKRADEIQVKAARAEVDALDGDVLLRLVYSDVIAIARRHRVPLCCVFSAIRRRV